MNDGEHARKERRGRHGIDDALILELAAGASVRGAAARLGIGESTISRRLRDPKFRARIEAARQELVAEAAGRLAGAMGNATAVLDNLLADDDPRVRLRAAVKIVELALRANRADEPAAAARVEIAMVQPLQLTDAQRATALAELHARFPPQQGPSDDTLSINE